MARTGDTSEAYMTLLFHLQPRVRREQNIHLHCFTGSESMVKEWTSVFPNTYFGFTRLVDRFDETQLRGLRAVQDSRILLETDAPYFQFSGGNSKPKFRHGTRYSAPILIGMTAAVVAEERSEDQVVLLRKTVANPRALYEST